MSLESLAFGGLWTIAAKAPPPTTAVKVPGADDRRSPPLIVFQKRSPASSKALLCFVTTPPREPAHLVLRCFRFFLSPSLRLRHFVDGVVAHATLCRPTADISKGCLGPVFPSLSGDRLQPALLPIRATTVSAAVAGDCEAAIACAKLDEAEAMDVLGGLRLPFL